MNTTKHEPQHTKYKSDSGVVVSIVAFQAVDPGSIPGCRSLVVVSLYLCCFLFIHQFQITGPSSSACKA